MNTEREYVYIAEGCVDARDIDFKMPDGIERCSICHGNGKYVQRYIEGRLSGPCDWCQGSGFKYKDGDWRRGVPGSVVNQIAVASGVTYRHFQAHGIDWRQDSAMAKNATTETQHSRG